MFPFYRGLVNNKFICYGFSCWQSGSGLERTEISCHLLEEDIDIICHVLHVAIVKLIGESRQRLMR